jgi:hypothetical protein
VGDEGVLRKRCHALRCAKGGRGVGTRGKGVAANINKNTITVMRAHDICAGSRLLQHNTQHTLRTLISRLETSSTNFWW